VAPLVLSAAIAAVCSAAAGMSLGFYLGPIALLTLNLPPLVAGEKQRFRAFIIAAAAIDGVGIAWLIAAVFGSRTTFLDWLQCYLVLVAYAAALWGLTRLLRSAALVTILALAWLSWPVWMSPWLTDAAIAWLVPAHPLLAINHVLLDLGVWTQQRVMYQVTGL
jgi:hypothetical protein